MAYLLLCQGAEGDADVLKDMDLESSEMIQPARVPCTCIYTPSTHTENEAWRHMSEISALGDRGKRVPGAHWPDFAEPTAPGSMRDAVYENQMESY